MYESIINNWKTTLASVFTAFFGYVLLYPQNFTAVPWLVHIAGFAAIGGLVTFGITAKQCETPPKFPAVLMCLCGLAFLTLTACATNTQTTTARAVLTIHDSVKTTAEAADVACKNQIIPPEDCAKIKVVYDKFRVSWPLVDDAMVLYLQSGSMQTQQKFEAAYGLFMQDYAEIFGLMLQFGVIKAVDGGNK